ncbi:MAG TPA: DUF192 domain-containing protein [Flavobacteriaceae bacterium]|nr:DUF192 domain-containing protein [Flavobacteriaceae bacterium]
MKKHYFLIFLISFGIFSGCKDDPESAIQTAEPTFTKEGELTFKNTEGEIISVFEVEIAKSSYEQQTGLMYRKSMEPNQGMLFVYPDERPRYGFYMKNTYIPLDLIYIDDEGKIVDFNENTEPFNETPLPSEVPAKYVLEVNAGIVDSLGLELGYLMELQLE